MYVEREIEFEINHWYSDPTKLALIVRGCRQIGKTTTISRFCKNHYSNTIKIDCSREKIRNLFEEEIGYADEYNIADCLERFCNKMNYHFEDSKSTVVFIDEIQSSKIVYESIRTLNRGLKCDVIVTGSYLEEAINFFQPAGDTFELIMHPLNFSEFFNAVRTKLAEEGNGDSLKFCLNDYKNLNDEKLKVLNKLYVAYCTIGGFPAIVEKYLDRESIEAINRYKNDLIRSLFSEIKARMNDRFDIEFLYNFLNRLVKTMLNERRGGINIENLTSSIKEGYKNYKINKRDAAKIIAWFKEAGWINFCGKYNLVTNARTGMEKFYFEDLGVLTYVVGDDWLSRSELRGIYAENFAYKQLSESTTRLYSTPIDFGILNEYEIDFVINHNHSLIAIEVKSGDSQGVSLRKAKKKIKIDKVVYAKGKCCYCESEGVITVPLACLREWYLDALKEIGNRDTIGASLTIDEIVKMNRFDDKEMKGSN